MALPSTVSSDEALVLGLLAGKKAAMGELFDRFRPLVRALLIRTLGSSWEVDDLTQETFLLVLRRCETLREPSALRSFVVGITLRVAKNELRKRAIRRWVGLGETGCEETPIRGTDPEEIECVRRVYRVLDRLDAHGRVLFVLRHIEGYELQEIARAVGSSLATVKRHLARAEARFSALCQKDPVLGPRLPTPEETPP